MGMGWLCTAQAVLMYFVYTILQANLAGKYCLADEELIPQISHSSVRLKVRINDEREFQTRKILAS
jgi:hypothetical protein